MAAENLQDFINEQVVFLPLLQEFDLRIDEIVFTATCFTWNVNWPNQILDGLLFIVKRTIEPTFQIILKPTLPGSMFCQFHCVESFGQNKHFVEVEHSFLLPGHKKGFVVCFNNLEDSTRALNCIRRLLGIEEETRNITYPITHVGITRVGQTEAGASSEIRETELPIDEQTEVVSEAAITHTITIPEVEEEHTITIPEVKEEHVGNANANAFDENAYLQNTRVILAMTAILFATIVFTVGLNPPESIKTYALSLKTTFQVTFWIGAVSSLAALLLLGTITPTSVDMQARIFRCAFVAISVSLLCVVIAFSATTVMITTNLVAMIAGGIIGVIGILIFSYFTSISVRGFILKFTGFRLTQHVDNTPYWLTSF